jgi:transglutaminase-like putative cysteine protease
VLLAALLRAAGIPARLVTGLVYLADFAGAEGVFGYHMWVQAWTGGSWLDLDATLPGGFDATHVALAVSDLAGPEPGGELDRLLPLVGKLRIRVLEVEP